MCIYRTCAGPNIWHMLKIVSCVSNKNVDRVCKIVRHFIFVKSPGKIIHTHTHTYAHSLHTLKIKKKYAKFQREKKAERIIKWSEMERERATKKNARKKSLDRIKHKFYLTFICYTRGVQTKITISNRKWIDSAWLGWQFSNSYNNNTNTSTGTTSSITPFNFTFHSKSQEHKRHKIDALT